MRQSFREEAQPFLYCSASRPGGGPTMICQLSIPDLLEDLQVASEHIGLTPEDIAFLLDAGVSVTDLLDYVEAAVSNRLD